MHGERQKIGTVNEQAIVGLPNDRWDWMAEKDVEKLAELFYENL